jgi:hypothetical protein
MSNISRSCVSSEDLKYETGADEIFCERQIGIGCTLSKDGGWIGYIEDFGIYLGDDIIIKEIKIYDNEELSKKLTEKHKSKILICSIHKDRFGS